MASPVHGCVLSPERRRGGGVKIQLPLLHASSSSSPSKYLFSLVVAFTSVLSLDSELLELVCMCMQYEGGMEIEGWRDGGMEGGKEGGREAVHRIREGLDTNFPTSPSLSATSFSLCTF